MSGICTAAPPHLDAHDKNSIYLYWSELGLNRRHAWMNDIFAILHIIIHNDHITQNWNCPSKITHCILNIFWDPPIFHKSLFQGSPCLIKGSRAPHSSPVVRTLLIIIKSAFIWSNQILIYFINLLYLLWILCNVELLTMLKTSDTFFRIFRWIKS